MIAMVVEQWTVFCQTAGNAIAWDPAGGRLGPFFRLDVPDRPAAFAVQQCREMASFHLTIVIDTAKKWLVDMAQESFTGLTFRHCQPNEFASLLWPNTRTCLAHSNPKKQAIH